MTGIEPRISGVVSDRSTTVPQPTLLFINVIYESTSYSQNVFNACRRHFQTNKAERP